MPVASQQLRQRCCRAEPQAGEHQQQAAQCRQLARAIDAEQLCGGVQALSLVVQQIGQIKRHGQREDQTGATDQQSEGLRTVQRLPGAPAAG